MKAILLAALLSVAAGSAVAQEKQTVSYKVEGQHNKIAKQLVIPIADMPGHNHVIRIAEVHVVDPANAITINGVKAAEAVLNVINDRIDGNGSFTTYAVWNMENGDEVFLKASGVGGPTGEAGYLAIGTITGGTGKFATLHGHLRETGTAPDANGIQQARGVVEYWFK
jgi:hypothetical protein